MGVLRTNSSGGAGAPENSTEVILQVAEGEKINEGDFVGIKAILGKTNTFSGYTPLDIKHIEDNTYIVAFKKDSDKKLYTSLVNRNKDVFTLKGTMYLVSTQSIFYECYIFKIGGNIVFNYFTSSGLKANLASYSKDSLTIRTEVSVDICPTLDTPNSPYEGESGLITFIIGAYQKNKDILVIYTSQGASGERTTKILCSAISLEGGYLVVKQSNQLLSQGSKYHSYALFPVTLPKVIDIVSSSGILLYVSHALHYDSSNGFVSTGRIVYYNSSKNKVELGPNNSFNSVLGYSVKENEFRVLVAKGYSTSPSYINDIYEVKPDLSINKKESGTDSNIKYLADIPLHIKSLLLISHSDFGDSSTYDNYLTSSEKVSYINSIPIKNSFSGISATGMNYAGRNRCNLDDEAFYLGKTSLRSVILSSPQLKSIFLQVTKTEGVLVGVAKEAGVGGDKIKISMLSYEEE